MPNSERAVEVFTEAGELPVEERAAFLARACAGEDELRRKIEALLRFRDRAGDFLEQPAKGENGVGRAEEAAAENPGDQVDRYRLLQQIGEGGCGVVFVAEQEEPIRRRVALKVIKPGMDTKSVIARFEAERQALALMDHPNIARVFDASATKRGRPYFVMEFVDGLKITDYSDLHSLSLRERLELLVQVCDAIQHAHQKGIIHRDIKPSNIIVATGADGKPVPKVIDFGIAKATTGQRLTDKTIFTSSEMLIGTPAYMSPEQAAWASSEVDTRSDIYSLGVLLYEVLTGMPPFDVRELLKVGFDEVRRAIRDEEPVRPSMRLRKMNSADLAEVAKRHGTEPPKLISAMHGDLDWIVMHALEKDRERRYATANGLAMDIKRYLSGEVVLARSPSTSYKFRKLVARNKLVFAGVTLTFVSLVVSLITTNRWLMIERRRNEQIDLRAEIKRLEGLGFTLTYQLKYMEAEQRYRQALALRGGLRGDELASERTFNSLLSNFKNQQRLDKIRPLLAEFASPAQLSRAEFLGVYQSACDMLARHGQWNDADALAEELQKAAPDNPNPYHLRAPLLAARGKVQEYRRVCGEMVARFGTVPDYRFAENTAKDCLILPLSGMDLTPVAAMADLAVSGGAKTDRAPYFQCCKAMAEFRQGHFEEAINRAHLVTPGQYSYPKAAAFAVIAMSQGKLNQWDEARIALAECNKIVAKELPELGLDLGEGWRDWIVAHAWQSEANRMIEGGPAAAAPPANQPR